MGTREEVFWAYERATEDRFDLEEGQLPNAPVSADKTTTGRMRGETHWQQRA